MLAAFIAPARAQDLAFVQDGEITSDTGHALISWQSRGEARLIISERVDLAEGTTLYEGTNTAYFLSGLGEGTYYLRLRDSLGNQSGTLRLTVVHQSLERAILLTIMGAIITLGIIATVARGARP